MTHVLEPQPDGYAYWLSHDHEDTPNWTIIGTAHNGDAPGTFTVKLAAYPPDGVIRVYPVGQTPPGHRDDRGGRLLQPVPGG
jgi:hypothetical protein